MPKSSAAADEPLSYGLKDLALFPTCMTAGAALSALLVALVRGGPEVYSLAAWFALGSAILFYSVTFLVGGLGLIPAALQRLRRRVARRRGRRIVPGKPLWDDWLDGP